MSSLFDFLYINFGLFTKLSALQYGSTLEDTSLIWCRIRTYLTWTLPCIATGFLLLASIDRCLSTSRQLRFRLFNQIKIAHRMTCIPIIVYSLTTSNQLFYYYLQPTCAALPGIYSYFLSMYSIFWTSLIPQGSMLIFALITYYHIKNTRRRVLPSRNRIDFQFIRLTLFQILCSSILLNIRTIYYAYVHLSFDVTKSSYRQTAENLFSEITSFIFYINFGKSFFVNTLTSKHFRTIFKERLTSFYRRIKLRKFRIHPNQAIVPIA
jgi:hypothetical protein